MLQKLNERIQGVVAWIVIILIAVTFTLFGIDYYLQSHQGSTGQVEVNGQPITKQAFELNYRRTRQQNAPAQMTAASEKQLKKQVMDEMILNSVSLQSARLNGFEVSMSQANAAIVSIPQFQEDGHFSADRYQQAISGAFFTPESFQKEVRQGMLLNQQRFAFIGTAFALPNEIKRFVKLYMQTRDYNYLSISVAPFVNDNNVTEPEVTAYYQQHQQEFISPEKVSVEYIRLSMPDIKAKLQVTDAQIKSYYDDNQTNYLTPAQWQVAHILFAVPEEATEAEQQQAKENADQAYQQLQTDPASFDEKVSTQSDDKISVKDKGVLPWIAAGQSEFDKVFVSLTAPGQITAPVRSSHGYEIFKLVAYKPAVVKPLSEVHADIQEQLLGELAQTQYAHVLEQLSDLSYQTPDSLAPVAAALKLPLEQSTLFTHVGGEDAFTKNKQIVNAAFSHDVLELGNNSEPIQFDNDSVVVLRVNNHLTAAKKTLAEVREAIVAKIATDKAKLQAQQLGTALINAEQNKTLQTKLIEQNNLQWHEVNEAGRDADKDLEAINELAFNLPHPGDIIGQTMESGEYVVVQLKKVNDGKIESLDNEQRASITQQLEASNGVMDYDLYVRDLLKKATIVNN